MSHFSIVLHACISIILISISIIVFLSVFLQVYIVKVPRAKQQEKTKAVGAVGRWMKQQKRKGGLIEYTSKLHWRTKCHGA